MTVAKYIAYNPNIIVNYLETAGGYVFINEIRNQTKNIQILV